jgi:catechol 2,3-dioxygenase-like lactoylglutathione lyase family enzyme
MAVRKAGRRTAPAAAVGSRKKKTSRSQGAAARQPDRRKSKTETLRLRSIEPLFTVSDLQKSLRFYTDVLGFIVSDRFTGENGVLQGVMLKAGVCEMGLSQDDWAKGRDRQRGAGVRVWCTTAQDIDALAARVKAAGHPLAEEPKVQAWGGRGFAVDDPDGFHLTIYRPDAKALARPERQPRTR